MKLIEKLTAYFGTPRQWLASSVFFILLFVLSRYLGERYLYVGYSAVFTFSILGLLACLRVPGVLLASIFLFGIALQLSYRFHFGENPSIGVLQSIVETNLAEARAMGGLTLRLFLLAVFPFLVLLGTFIYLARNRAKKIIGASLVVSLVATVVLWPLPVDRRFMIDVQSYPALAGELYRRINNLVFADMAVLVGTSLTDLKYAQDQTKKIHESIIGKSQPVNDVVIVVIGESSFVGRYGAYGYSVDTTPNLTRLRADSNACFVNKVHSAAPITRNSISMTFSYRSPESFQPLLSQKSLIDLAHENKFRTYWIASQPLRGPHETEYGFLAKESDVVWQTDGEDNELPRLFEKALKENLSPKRKFIVLHMAGSHWPYSRQFDPVDALALPNADDYDKSIHKTDRVLGAVLNSLTQAQVRYTALYFPDHGELVGKGHGLSSGGPDQYLIPYVVLASNGVDDLCASIEAMRGPEGYFSTLSNKFILLRLLGYKLNSDYVDAEVKNDRVLHSDGRIYSWGYFMNEDANIEGIADLR